MSGRGFARIGLAALLAAGILVLSACHKWFGQKGEDQRQAAGQVLSGSISDAMLPYDALTSSPPKAPERAKGGSSAEEAASDAASAATDAASSAQQAPAAGGDVAKPSVGL